MTDIVGSNQELNAQSHLVGIQIGFEGNTAVPQNDFDILTLKLFSGIKVFVPVRFNPFLGSVPRGFVFGLRGKLIGIDRKRPRQTM